MTLYVLYDAQYRNRQYIRELDFGYGVYWFVTDQVDNATRYSSMAAAERAMVEASKSLEGSKVVIEALR